MLLWVNRKEFEKDFGEISKVVLGFKLIRSEEADELIQDICHKLVESSATLPRILNRKKWLRTISRNECISHLRRKKGEKMVVQEYEKLRKDDAHRSMPESLIELEQVLSNCGEEQKKILIMNSFGHTSREIGGAVNKSIRMVDKKLREIREKIGVRE